MLDSIVYDNSFLYSQLSLTNSYTVLKNALPEDQPFCNFYMIHEDIINAKTLDPFTHVCMFDLGFPPEVLEWVAKAFNASTHTHYLVAYAKPIRVIDEFGFHVEVYKKLEALSMCGKW